MVICFRCQRNIAEFECEICNGIYCTDCDTFIHSNRPKNNHTRKKLKINLQIEKPKEIIKIPTNQNTNNCIINTNNHTDSLYKTYIENNNSSTVPMNEMAPENEIKLLSQTYTPPPMKKIVDQPQNQVRNDINNNNMQDQDEINVPQKRKINLSDCADNINYENNNMISNKEILNEKDEEIKYIQKEIEKYREIINQIKSENNNLEELIEKDRAVKDELYKEKERLYNNKRIIDDFYYEKQNEIQKIHDLEKYKLIEEYENQIREISDNFISRKSEYIKGIQDIEEKKKEMEKKNDEEKKNMFEEIDRLKSEGLALDKEQEYLIKMNDELNNKLRETTNKMDLLKATTIVKSVPKMKSLLKYKKKKTGH